MTNEKHKVCKNCSKWHKYSSFTGIDPITQEVAHYGSRYCSAKEGAWDTDLCDKPKEFESNEKPDHKQA